MTEAKMVYFMESRFVFFFETGKALTLLKQSDMAKGVQPPYPPLIAPLTSTISSLVTALYHFQLPLASNC